MKVTVSGIERITIGKARVERIRIWKASRPRKAKRASASPAGAPISSERTSVSSPTTTLLRADGRTPVELRKKFSVSVEKAVGISDLGKRKTALRGLKAAMTIR